MLRAQAGLSPRALLPRTHTSVPTPTSMPDSPPGSEPTAELATELATEPTAGLAAGHVTELAAELATELATEPATEALGGIPVAIALPQRVVLPPAPHAASSRPLILSVEGLIGAGKSTLLRVMERMLGTRVLVIQEDVELWRALPDPHNPTMRHNLLEQYYKDAAKLAMPFQTFIVATHVTALTNALADIATRAEHERPDVILVERSSGGNACFAHMLFEDGMIDAAWYAAYNHMRTLFARFVPDADGIIDMNVDVDTAMERLHQRARGEEVGVSPAYQAHLFRTIKTWLDNETRPVLTLSSRDCHGAHVDDRRASMLATHILDFAHNCVPHT